MDMLHLLGDCWVWVEVVRGEIRGVCVIRPRRRGDRDGLH